MPKVKICGITRLEDAKMACEAGADFIGFVFVKDTPRVVDEEKVKNIIFSDSFKECRRKIEKVGLFANEEIESIVGTVSYCGLDYVQLHGDAVENSEYCLKLKDIFRKKGLDCKIIKAVKVKENIFKRDIEGYAAVDFFLFDTYSKTAHGGTGEKFNWKLLKELDIDKDFFLAGGLNPDNVIEAVETVKPYAVDVSSGVEEKPGKKDYKKVKEFIDNAKSAG